jgi:hypothetical protein
MVILSVDSLLRYPIETKQSAQLKMQGSMESDRRPLR